MIESGQPITVGNAIKLANDHLQSRRLGEAEAIYRQVLAVNPSHFDALHYLGVIAMQVGKFEQAAALISRAIQHNPSSYAAHNNLGVALMQRGRLREAAQSFQQALSIKEDYTNARTNLARVHLRLGNHGTGLDMMLSGTGHARFTQTSVKLLWKLALVYMTDWFGLVDVSCDLLECVIGA